VGVAVNVTAVPLQMVDAVDDMETLAVCAAVIAIVIELDVAGDPVAQVAFDVITQVTTSPFTRPDVV
jgi:hypothetical protein